MTILLTILTKSDLFYFCSILGGVNLFCPCGCVAYVKCTECSNRGYCSQNCLDTDRLNHKMFCRPKIVAPSNAHPNTFTG